MPKFRNPHPHAITVQWGAHSATFAPGEETECSHPVAAAIIARGTRLTLVGKIDPEPVHAPLAAQLLAAIDAATDPDSMDAVHQRFLAVRTQLSNDDRAAIATKGEEKYAEIVQAMEKANATEGDSDPAGDPTSSPVDGPVVADDAQGDDDAEDAPDAPAGEQAPTAKRSRSRSKPQPPKEP
jgi:hypothetical protein